MRLAAWHRYLVEPVQGRRLTVIEREQILAGINAEHSIRRIARELGRHPSTVLRELRKNMLHQQYRGRYPNNPHFYFDYFFLIAGLLAVTYFQDAARAIKEPRFYGPRK